MKNIAKLFDDTYQPEKALIIFRVPEKKHAGIYVESYDIDNLGMPINAHPLSVKESAALSLALKTAEDKNQAYMQCAGIFPKNLLHLHFAGEQSHVIWMTPAHRQFLIFIDQLGIPNGIAAVPPLIWKASKKKLQVWSVKSSQNPTGETPLYNAPFFNIYDDATVCMGTVKNTMDACGSLEEFIDTWERDFWTSAFSHLIKVDSPVKGNIIQLWQGLIGTAKKFPAQELLKTGLTLNDLLR